jgi:AbrB family looped-hinge helix DNA binding protein
VKAIVSTKGQIVIPDDLRQALGIHPGDTVTIKRSNQRIILEKDVVMPKAKLKLIKGKMPIIEVPRRAGQLTSAMVKEIAEL